MRAQNEAQLRGARTLVEICAALRRGERALVLANPATEQLADLVAAAAADVGAEVTRVTVPESDMHGREPPAEAAAAMLGADAIFCLTRMSLAHSQARRAATDRGARYLSLPDYSPAVLASPALTVDFRGLVLLADSLADRIDRVGSIRVTSALGTDLSFETGGRKTNRAPGVVDQPGMLGSPPDAEVNIAPLEGTARGRIAVDGSVPCREVGLLRSPLMLMVERGMVVGVHSDDQTAAVVEAMFAAAGVASRNVGEFGLGLNPKAQLCGVMLEDEGTLGTAHFGIGANATIGGTVAVPFHLDFVFRAPTVTLDDGTILVSDGAIMELA